MNRAAFGVLVLWAFLAPLLLGSVPEAEISDPGVLGAFFSAGGAYLVFKVLGILAFGLALADLVSRPGSHVAPDRRSRLLLGLLTAILVLGFLQLLPLPRFIHAIVAPAHVADLDRLQPGWTWATISIDATLTKEAVVRWFLLFGAAISVLTTVRTVSRAYILLGALIAAGALGAAYGMVETYLLSDTVLGFGKVGAGGGVTGTFIYRGNFNAYTAGAFGIALAGIVASFRNRKPLFAGLCAIAAVLLASGILLSGSRAGLLAVAAAGAGALFLSSRSKILRAGIVVGAVAAVVGAALFVGSVRERFEYLGQTEERGFADVRLPAWSSTLDLAKGRPVFGSGEGTYRLGIHLTQSDLVPDELYFSHSDPLNYLADGGAVMFLLAVALVLIGLFGAIHLTRDEHLGGVGTAAAAGLLGLLAMAVVDFPLQIPATALMFFLLLFLPAAVRRRDPAMLPMAPKARALAGIPVFLLAVGFVILAFAGYLEASKHPGGVSRMHHSAREGAELLEQRKSKEALELLTIARNDHPFDGTIRYYLARALFTRGKFDEAGRELEAAFHLARGKGELLFRTGSMAYRMQLPFAMDALREAGALEPKHFTAAMKGLPAERVPEIVPERPFAYEQLGKWHRTRGENEEAIAAFWKAYDLSDGRASTAHLQKLYQQLDREEEGKKEFEKHGAKWP